MDVRLFRQLPILGIIRCDRDIVVEELVETIVASGLRTVEIAMNSHNAPGLIRRAVASAGGRLTIGAGTVLSTQILSDALDAGATFAVMPTLVTDVVDQCARHGIPVFPGAFTPQEVYDAWNAGATMVKVFPAAMFGPPYIRELKAPFGRIDLLACGGVNAENIASFFSAGASAVAFGSSIFRKDWLAERDFAKVGIAIRELIAGYGT